MTRTADVAVIGAGIVGLSTAYALRERGATVCVYERGLPGAAQSGGDSRVFRHAHEDPRLIERARQSRAIYREWGDELAVELVSGDGVVWLGPDAPRYLAKLRAAGVDAAEIGSTELAERVPLLADFDGPAFFDAEGGSIRAAAAIEALAGRLADDLVADEVVAVWPSGPGTVEVRTHGARGEHGSAIVCAGAETASLARGLGVSIPVELSLHGRVTFALHGEPPAHLPCLLDGTDAFGETGAYGTPSPDSTRYSIGVGGRVAAREDVSLLAPPTIASVTDGAVAYVRNGLPGLDPEPVAFRHCWVTSLPWSVDAIGVWEADGVRFLVGDNLFKHAPGLGRALADAALEDRLADDLRPEARLGEPQQVSAGLSAHS